MASSSCMRLCHRCTRSVLHSKVASVALQYSTIQVQRCSFTALRISSSTNNNNKTTGFPALSGRSHTVVAPHATDARHRWKQHLYYGVGGKPLSTEAKENKDTDTGELSRTNAAVAAAPYKNRLSRRIGDVVPPSAASQTASLDLDARRPRLSALEEISDEEARRPRLSALEEISDEEAISISVSSALPPPASLSLSEYVDKSETLSKLVQLGVNLWRLEQRPNVGSMLLRLDFQADVAPRLLFLKDLGLEDSGLGRLLSHNPFILTESLENLTARVNYLLSKKFSSQTVASMVARAPYLLNFSVKRLDNRLGFFQKHLGLSPDNTRDVVARLPRLLCGSLEPVKETLKVCKVEFGFKENEIQHIIIAVPKVLTANKKKLTQIFDYLHNTMNVPHHLIIKFPQVLNCRYLRIRERHLFLQYLSKDQYDPSGPNYVSLDRLAALPDDAFCTEVASATLEDFYLFQKTL